MPRVESQQAGGDDAVAGGRPPARPNASCGRGRCGAWARQRSASTRSRTSPTPSRSVTGQTQRSAAAGAWVHALALGLDERQLVGVVGDAAFLTAQEAHPGDLRALWVGRRRSGGGLGAGARSQASPVALATTRALRLCRPGRTRPQGAAAVPVKIARTDPISVALIAYDSATDDRGA